MKKSMLFFVSLFCSIIVFAQFPSHTWDTITFEKPYNDIIMNDIPENIWQIGTPSKVYFDSAFSFHNAIVTDTLNIYPTNNYSYFDLYLSVENVGWYPQSVSVEFLHKFNTDTLKDGGFITVSYDMGATWMNIIEDDQMPGFGVPFSEDVTLNIYSHSDSLINGNFGFSGSSNGWIKTRISNFSLLVKYDIWSTDTTILRFNFISDGIQTNKEGWMIDNIRLYSCDFGPGNIYETSQQNTPSIYPNPASDYLNIDYKNSELFEISLMSMEGKIILSEKSNSEHYVLNIASLENGIYLLKVSDANRSKVIKIVKQ